MRIFSTTISLLLLLPIIDGAIVVNGEANEEEGQLDRDAEKIENLLDDGNKMDMDKVGNFLTENAMEMCHQKDSGSEERGIEREKGGRESGKNKLLIFMEVVENLCDKNKGEEQDENVADQDDNGGHVSADTILGQVFSGQNFDQFSETIKEAESRENWKEKMGDQQKGGTRRIVGIKNGKKYFEKFSKILRQANKQIMSPRKGGENGQNGIFGRLAQWLDQSLLGLLEDSTKMPLPSELFASLREVYAWMVEERQNVHPFMEERRAKRMTNLEHKNNRKWRRKKGMARREAEKWALVLLLVAMVLCRFPVYFLLANIAVFHWTEEGIITVARFLRSLTTHLTLEFVHSMRHRYM